jgi:hypothetical protein
MVAAYLLSKNGLRVTGSSSSINHWAAPILKSHGLTRKRIAGDPIGVLLKTRFKISLPTEFSFRQVFSREEYMPALTQLNSAEGSYLTNRSLWVTHLDNFNQMILEKTYEIVGMNIDWGDVFGSIDSIVLRNTFPDVAATFKDCHRLRLICPVPHVYSRTLRTFARDIRIKERNRIESVLRTGYLEFIRNIT